MLQQKAVTKAVSVVATILYTNRCICSVFKRSCMLAYIGVTEGEDKVGGMPPIFFSKYNFWTKGGGGANKIFFFFK